MKMMLPRKSERFIRDRFKNYASPGVGGPIIWTEEEDEILSMMYNKFPGKWDKIAEYIGGKRGVDCKIRWTLLSKGIVKRQGRPPSSEIGEEKEECGEEDSEPTSLLTENVEVFTTPDGKYQYDRTVRGLILPKYEGGLSAAVNDYESWKRENGAGEVSFNVYMRWIQKKY